MKDHYDEIASRHRKMADLPFEEKLGIFWKLHSSFYLLRDELRMTLEDRDQKERDQSDEARPHRL